MNKIINEILLGAKDGKVVIDDEVWGIAFNTVIYDENMKIKANYFNERNMATLVIRNEEEFINILSTYVSIAIESGRKYHPYFYNKEENTFKLFASYLFTNFSTEDFLSPESAIKRHIEYLSDDTFSYLDQVHSFGMNEKLGATLEVKRELQAIGMETPYKLSFQLAKQNGEEKLNFPLAEISYGIVEENGEKVCYVYSLIKPKEKKGEKVSEAEETFRKKINRTLFKLNSGVLEQESDDYKDYRSNGGDMYIENISDVTQPFVLAVTSFVSLLQKEGITKIKLVPYLPLRYSSRYNAALNVRDLDRQTELFNRNNRIQENATDKFMRTFRRVMYHLNGSMQLVTIPYDVDEYMTFRLDEQNTMINNPILEGVAMSILNDEDVKEYHHGK